MAEREDAYRHFIDKSALHELVMTYCRAADRRDFALMRTLYHDDAIDDHGQMFCGPVDQFIPWVTEVVKQFEATRHEISNALFKIEGDVAEGESYAIAYHRTFPPDAKEIVIGGRYLDRFARRDGAWKFIRRALALDWANVRTVDPAAYAEFAAGADLGRSDEEDPSYRVLSLFRRGAA